MDAPFDVDRGMLGRTLGAVSHEFQGQEQGCFSGGHATSHRLSCGSLAGCCRFLMKSRMDVATRLNWAAISNAPTWSSSPNSTSSMTVSASSLYWNDISSSP